MRDSDTLKRGWREPLALAAGLWALNFIAHTGFILAVGMHPVLIIAAAAWSLHGMALTWPLHLLVWRGHRLPPIVRWACLGAAVALLTYAQIRLDMIFSRLTVEAFAPPSWGGAVIMLRNADGTEDIGPEISVLIYFWVFSCYAVAASLLQAQRRLFNSERRAQAAELEALRLQLNPHFLLNALNSVSSLIVTGRHEEADRTTLNLAEFLHGALTAPNAGLTPLSDELANVEAYLQIETVRFGDRLQVEIDVPGELERLLVPSFVLQPLVENAVKYAVATANKPVTVRVSASVEGGVAQLTVADDGDPARVTAVRSGTGVGLKTTRERLRALYGERASLETERRPDGFTAVVTLPFALAEARPLARPELSRAA